MCSKYFLGKSLMIDFCEEVLNLKLPLAFASLRELEGKNRVVNSGPSSMVPHDCPDDE